MIWSVLSYWSHAVTHVQDLSILSQPSGRLMFLIKKSDTRRISFHTAHPAPLIVCRTHCSLLGYSGMTCINCWSYAAQNELREDDYESGFGKNVEEKQQKPLKQACQTGIRSVLSVLVRSSNWVLPEWKSDVTTIWDGKPDKWNLLETAACRVSLWRWELDSTGYRESSMAEFWSNIVEPSDAVIMGNFLNNLQLVRNYS
jgi:hypothetical protein